MLESDKKEQKGTCIGCGGSVELVEIDVQKGKKFVKCTSCGMVHVCEKDFLGRWQLKKAYKNPSLP